MSQNNLDKHILSTYFTLRMGIAVIAIAFPFVLWIGGGSLYADLPIRPPSMSAYYWEANPVDGKSLRDVFVGVLFAVGAFLYLYKGFSDKENIALNIAGILAVGVALFPTCRGQCPKVTIHGIFAVGFFLSITFVAVKCAPDTLGLITDENLRAKFRMMYKTLAMIMLASPAAAYVLNVLTPQYNAFLFYVEAGGIFAFAAYWLTKSRELSLTQAEENAVRGKVNKAELIDPKSKQ